MFDKLLVIGLSTFTLYILMQIARSRTSNKQKAQSDTAYHRMCFGAILGFILGFAAAFSLNPPYDGIWKTSSDVQGLVVASWIGGGGLGAILFTIGSLFSHKMKKKI